MCIFDIVFFNNQLNFERPWHSCAQHSFMQVSGEKNTYFAGPLKTLLHSLFRDYRNAATPSRK